MPVEPINILLVVLLVLGIPRMVFSFCIEQNHVVSSTALLHALFCVTVSTTSLPCYLLLEVPVTEGFAHLHLDVVRSMPVEMHVDATRLLEHPMAFPETFDHPSYIVLYATLPPITEYSHLCAIAPDDLIVAVAKERRVKIDEINAVVREIPGEDFKIITTQDYHHTKEQHPLSYVS